MKTIFIHGSGHKSTSWNETISYTENNREIFCPDLSSILNGKEASYKNLYSSLTAVHLWQNDAGLGGGDQPAGGNQSRSVQGMTWAPPTSCAGYIPGHCSLLSTPIMRVESRLR
jgi:hypothetical protein